MKLFERAREVAAGLVLVLVCCAAVAAAPPLQQFESKNIKTLSLSSEISTENQAELKKISGDIALAYRLHKGSMQYEQPGKLRIEASVPLIGSGYYIVNGNRKLTSAPFVHRVQDITGEPGKKQTLLDFGLVPPELFDDYNATFVKKDGTALVYNITPKKKSETFRTEVWIDPKTKITIKHVEYDRHGVLVKIVLYKNPIEAAPGIYIPTRLELYNPENKLAGVTGYQNIKVNQPIPESRFTF